MIAAAGALALTLAAAGHDATQAVDVRAAPLGRALVALAAQLHVSFGGEVGACVGEARALKGRYTAARAFDRLTRGTSCRVAQLDAQTWVARPAPRAASAARPLGLPPALLSRSFAEVEGAAVSEVQVTAGRRATELATYAGSSSEVEGVALGEAAHRSLQDLTRDIAVLETTNLGPGRDKLFVRGLSDGTFSGAAASAVALYLDDLPISYNAPDPDLRLADMARVEVLSGPQGALFGAGAIGGVVRLVPRSPDLGVVSGAVETGLSTVAHGGTGDDLEGTVNLPLISDRLAVRAVAYREREPGYIDDVGLGRSDVNSTNRVGGRLAALLQISPNWSATAMLVYQDIDSASSQYVVDGATPLTRRTSTPTPQDNDFGVLSVGLSGRLPFATLRLSAAMVRHTALAAYDATPALSLFDQAGSGPAAYDERHRRALDFGEAVLTSLPSGRAAWSAGVFLAHSTDDSRETLSAATTSPVLFREDRRDQLDEAAVFGEAADHLSSRLTVRAGLRVFRSTLAVAARDQQPVFSTSATYAGDVTTIDASPKVQFEFQASDRLFTYASFATGYRPATLNTAALPAVPFGQDGEVRLVRSDAARTYEVGAKWTLAVAAVQGAVFYTDWLGIQSDQYSALGLPMAVNIGDGAVFGLQLQGRWSLPAGFSTSGSLLLADQSLTADRNPSFPSRADAGLPGVSPVSAALSLAWRRDFGAVTLSGQVRARYVGPSRLSFTAGEVGRQGNYLDDSAEVSLSRGVWSLTLSAENLADGRANTFAFGDPFLPASTRQATPLRPRALTLTLRRDF